LLSPVTLKLWLLSGSLYALSKSKTFGILRSVSSNSSKGVNFYWYGEDKFDCISFLVLQTHYLSLSLLMIKLDSFYSSWNSIWIAFIISYFSQSWNFNSSIDGSLRGD
jgi:hypothetical protein